MALTRAEISRRYRERNQTRCAEANRRYYAKQRTWLLKQAEIQQISEALASGDREAAQERDEPLTTRSSIRENENPG